MHGTSKKTTLQITSKINIGKKLLLFIAILCLASFCLPGNAHSLLPEEENASRGRDMELNLPEKPGEISEWKEYVQDIWFYDREMEKVVPQPDYNWIVVKFADGNGYSTGDELPRKIERLNSDVQEHITQYIHDPSVSENMVAYRTTQSNLPRILEKTRENRKVEYVHPALGIKGKLYATLNKLEIKWKTSMQQNTRRKLLNAVHARDYKHLLQKRTERVEIDFHKIPVWQAANLLAEDVHVAYARPLLLELKKPITCDFQVEQPGGNIGTPISFNLKIHFREHININPGSIVNMDLAPQGISEGLIDINYHKPLSTINVNKSPVNISGEIHIYTPGEFEIPRIPVAYKYKENDKFKVKNTYTERTTLKIGSLVPEQKRKYRMKTAERNVQEAVASASSGNGSAGFYLLLSLICALLAAIAIFCFLYLLLGGKETETLEESPELTNLRNSLANWANKDIEEFDTDAVVKLSRNIRRYILIAYDIPTPLGGGASERFMQNVSEYLPSDLQETVLEIESNLEEIIARNRIDSDKLGNTQKLLRKLIDRKRQ